MKIFISGKPGVGKTTLLKNVSDVLKKSGVEFGGFITLEIREHGTRKGFEVIDIITGKREVFASIDFNESRVGKYGVNVKRFEEVAIPAVERGIKSGFLLIDEIGRMEMKSQWFNEKIRRILNSKIYLIATLHRNYVKSFKNYGEIYIITLDNRKFLFNKIIKMVKKNFLSTTL